MTAAAQNPNSRRLGYILIGIAALLTVSLIAGDGAGWLWIGAIATGFLYFHRQQRQAGLAVPGGILAGVSAGILFDSIFGFDSAFLVGLAGGFYLVALLFVLFDIEVVFMYPWAVNYKEMLKSNAVLALGGMVSFLGILFIGYVYALKKKAFDWKN